MPHIAQYQPIVPHYRVAFFKRMEEKVGSQDVYTYEGTKEAANNSFCVGNLRCEHIPSVVMSCGVVVSNPLPLLSKKYNVLVLMLHWGHLTTWLLLLTKWLHRKKIILWGQGISVKRYLKEEKKPDWKFKLMISLADGVWFYMDKEKDQWQSLFPKKPMVALRNTLSGVEQMSAYAPAETIGQLKSKYAIQEERILIFCARFNSYRRIDLLLEVIQSLDKNRFGFIIIGAGENKPDFSRFPNVHDFGKVYDDSVKRELFSIADIYFQPGWVGLSIVEAMAYGKPIFTFKRTEDTLQCVEYSYIKDSLNGRIFSTVTECLSTIETISDDELKKMGANARTYVKNNLTIEHMVNNGLSVINQVTSVSIEH